MPKLRKKSLHASFQAFDKLTWLLHKFKLINLYPTVPETHRYSSTNTVEFCDRINQLLYDKKLKAFRKARRAIRR